jgi:hypothetical protein
MIAPGVGVSGPQSSGPTFAVTHHGAENSASRNTPLSSGIALKMSANWVTALGLAPAIRRIIVWSRNHSIGFVSRRRILPSSTGRINSANLEKLNFRALSGSKELTQSTFLENINTSVEY